MLNTKYNTDFNQVELNWSRSELTNDYTLRRKEFEAKKWDTLVSSSIDTFYIDENIELNKLYEYSIINRIDDENTAYGYNTAGVLFNYPEEVKSILILVDDYIYSQANEDINKYKMHLMLDGYKVFVAEAPRTEYFSSENVLKTKDIIDRIYQEDRIDYLILLGRIAVPYSGAEAIDGHNNHYGAWNADAFYGIFSDKWSDTIIETKTAADNRQHNIPEDGKYDQTDIPDSVKISVSRIDFFKLFDITKDEITLYKEYINKVIKYAEAKEKYTAKGLIDDHNEIFFDDVFAAEAYINYYSLFNEDTGVETGRFLPNAVGNSYSMLYAASLGQYDELVEVISTKDFNTTNLRSPILCMIGSYFCDWDSDNNLLRAALTSGYLLNSYFGGRPYWHLHKMKFGDRIGDVYLQTINNDGLYSSPAIYGYQGLHISLLGDPTTKLNRIDIPTEVKVAYFENSSVITWEYNDEEVLGFDVFHFNENDKEMHKLNSELVKGKTFQTDLSDSKYAVRAVKEIKMQEGSFVSYSKAAEAKEISLVDIPKEEIQFFFNKERNFIEVSLDNKDFELNIYNYLGELLYKNSYFSNCKIYFSQIPNLNNIGIVFIIIRNKKFSKYYIINAIK